MKVSVSYLKNKNGIEETLKTLEKTSCNAIHVDLMDGIFAGTKNYEIDQILSLFWYIKKPLDIHLMIEKPDVEIESLAILNPKYITVHIEIENVKKYISKIKGLGIGAGIAVNPETKIEDLEPLLEQVDLVLLMSVEPGRGGQKFIDSTIEKLKKLQNIRKKKNHYFSISVDGGINENTVSSVIPYVDMVVSGSFVCEQENMEEQIRKLRKE